MFVRGILRGVFGVGCLFCDRGLLGGLCFGSWNGSSGWLLGGVRGLGECGRVV